MSIFAILLSLILGLLAFGVVSSVSTESGSSEMMVVEEATEAESSAITFVLVERADNITNLDLGDPGPSAGDLIVWGPNLLFEEGNVVDSGAVTQGFCVLVDASGQCELVETILFEDSSTLELQGVQAAGSVGSARTIVGGSGAYLGASGVVTIEPSDDLTLWTKTFEIRF